MRTLSRDEQYLLALGNSELAPGERRVLEWLVGGDGTRELEKADRGGWWMENHRMSGKTAWSLIRKCLVSQEGGPDSGGGITRWHINEWGKRRLAGRAVYLQKEDEP